MALVGAAVLSSAHVCAPMKTYWEICVMSAEMDTGGCLKACPVCHVTAAVTDPTVRSAIK